MTWIFSGNIDHDYTFKHVDNDDIHIIGKIDGGSTAVMVSNNGGITIDDKVDGGSNVSLTAHGNISIGHQIDGSSTVTLVSKAGTVTVGGDINGSSYLSIIADGDIHLAGKIDGSSTVVFVSNNGSIMIDGKVDGSSKATLTAAGDVRIGLVGGDGDKKIDGSSHVVATSGSAIFLGNKIDASHTSVDFKACTGITIVNWIAGGATVRLMTATGSISVGDKIGDSSTHVQFWPPNSLTVGAGVQDGAHVDAVQWAAQNVGCMPAIPSFEGYWWQNWPQTFGYVSPPRALPRSLPEISQAIINASPPGAVPIVEPIKAVGGGWSFTDASLPFTTQAEVDQVSTVLRGAPGSQDMHDIMQGLGDATNTPMDLLPETVAADLPVATRYDQMSMSQLTRSGAVLPGSTKVRLIDTRGLASSLHCRLHGILSREAKRRKSPDGSVLYHVEAGITMADLDQLLDHESPRLAIQASGGSPGATLAGTLSTATHGGEFAWPLLVDRVKAVHVVGPGGEEWWIEGAESIADPTALHNRYPRLDAAHFIGGAWSAIPGLNAQDVLAAVVVSMGTMGVIYSVVLEVVPQYGLQQIVTRTTWSNILGIAGTTEDALRQGDPAANLAVLEVILGAKPNGTGVSLAENVYADLAINPFNQDSWITNRRVMQTLPVDGNSPPTKPGDYISALSQALGTQAVDNVGNSALGGRLFDFLSYATDLWNPDDAVHDITSAANLVGFLLKNPDVLTAAVAMVSAQAVVNTVNAPGHPDRGQQFLGDMLSGFLDALQGTSDGNSDRTDIAYKVGAIGWPDGGVPGRGIEIALHQSRAFSFLQTELFDDILKNTMVGQNKPLVGYISIRVCPPTGTLMGMQQFSPYSIMIEVVGYRSPEANVVMDQIQRRVLDLNEKRRLNAMLHWGLENQMLTAADLPHTPLAEIVSGSALSKADAFRAVRQLIRHGQAPVFDNNFVNRLQL
jgi:hypothetical protein